MSIMEISNQGRFRLNHSDKGCRAREKIVRGRATSKPWLITKPQEGIFIHDQSAAQIESDSGIALPFHPVVFLDIPAEY
jgi:hypothetical protein